MPRTKQPKPQDKNKKKLPQFYQAVGRRKTATARVRLYPVTGKEVNLGNLSLSKNQIVVNNRTIQEYFPGKVLEKLYFGPFMVTNTMDRFAATVKVLGSGLYSQLGAITHGISRALLEVDNEHFKPLLRKEGYLTRDPREKERRKAGLAGKARAGKQSPKR